MNVKKNQERISTLPLRVDDMLGLGFIFNSTKVGPFHKSNHEGVIDIEGNDNTVAVRHDGPPPALNSTRHNAHLVDDAHLKRNTTSHARITRHDNNPSRFQLLRHLRHRHERVAPVEL